MRYIIIGGGIAGMTAAQVLREHDAEAKITVLTNEVHPFGLYVRKDLARNLGKGTLNDKTLLIENEQTLKLHNINFVYEAIERIYPRRHEILRKHSIRQSYDRLLLAVGSTPKLVNARGLHLIGVHQIRSYEDAHMIEAWLPDLRKQGAVVIGGGILGLDMVYALHKRGVPTTLVVRDAHVGKPLLTETAARILEQWMRMDGIEVILEQEVKAYLSQDEKVLDGIQLSNGEVINTRMALSCIGVHASTSFVEDEVETDLDTGTVLVNPNLLSSAADIYAAGGCANINGFIARNWQVSAEQGRVAALNMLGQQTEYTTFANDNLDTQIYNLPLAHFGQTIAQSTKTQTWAWDDDHSQFAQVLLEDDKIVGVTLIGETISLASTLWQAYQSKTATQISDLESLLIH